MEKTSHHHGDLRNALIKAGLDILDKEGFEALTLRKAAALAGVSHAAPAHHFAGKAGLLSAIAAHGYDLFTQFMQIERFANGNAASDQLSGIAHGYLKFAEQHPALFVLIFSTELSEGGDPDPDLVNSSARAYGVLAEVCALFEPSPLGAGVNELAVWSCVHGYAELRRLRRRMTGADGAIIPIEAVLPELTPRNA